jgi:hypothetical protein
MVRGKGRKKGRASTLVRYHIEGVKIIKHARKIQAQMIKGSEDTINE